MKKVSMLQIIREKNANQNYSDISLHTRKDSYYNKQKQKQEITRIG